MEIIDGSAEAFLRPTQTEIVGCTQQVDRITCHWNGMIAHMLGGPEDARDVYVKQTGLHDLMYRPGFRIFYRDLDLTIIPTEEAMDMP